MSKSKQKTVRLMALIIIAAVASAAIFLLSYSFDNKYTKKSTQPISGVLLLSEEDLLQSPTRYLINDWEIYRGRLLSPDDFKQSPPLPDELVFIGQYSGFEGKVTGNTARSPHGEATYRLNIALPSTTKSYTLELPEIFSAYRLYINGSLLAEMGSIDPQNYHPETGNSFVTVQAKGMLEILIAVSDYNCFYSGMVYPPAFGDSAAVIKILNTKFAIRLVAVSIALCIGLLYLGIWLLTKKDRKKSDDYILTPLYCVLCFSFIASTCCPIVKTLVPGGLSLYTIEKVSYCIMILMAMLIQSRISSFSKILTKISLIFAICFCFLALVFSHFIGDSLFLVMAYSTIIELYLWISAAFLFISTAYSVFNGEVYSKTMMTGSVFFAMSLIMDRLLPMFEPIALGWFTEISGAVFVVFIGFMMTVEVSRQFRLWLALEGRVESVARMMEMQKAYYPVILEKEEEARVTRHDLRHHMAAVRELLASDDRLKLTSYLDSYDNKYLGSPSPSYCNHYITDILLRMYQRLAQNQNTQISIEAQLPEKLSISDVDLCVIISNLLENALEASARIPESKRYIVVRIRYKLNRLGIFIQNNFDGELKIKNNRFFSQKQSDREGIGLYSVRAVCEHYGGKANFYSDKDISFHSEVVIPIVDSEGDVT